MKNETRTIAWQGFSGKTYQYWIYEIGTNFVDKPGNYCFAKEVAPNRWAPLYFGQTDSLDARLADHHKMDCAKRHGATHIHAHTNDRGVQARLAEETDLIRRWNPVCNG